MARTAAASPIGGPVRRFRLAAGLTQADLADMTGIAPETLSRIETNRAAGVSMALCTRLAHALRVPVADLFKEPPAPNRSALRPAERAILAIVGDLDENGLNDVLRMLRLALRVGRQLHGRPRGAKARNSRKPPSKRRAT